MKLTRELGLISTNTLDQDHRLHTKEFFNLWIDNSSLSNANKFLSFHTIQNIHKRATCHAFLLAVPTKDPCCWSCRYRSQGWLSPIATVLIYLFVICKYFSFISPHACIGPHVTKGISLIIFTIHLTILSLHFFYLRSPA